MSEQDTCAAGGSSRAKLPELAVFGGSFDPPHIGHVFLATYALSVAGVARVIVAPTFEHAFGKALSPFEHRRRMCELAFAPLRGVEVSSLERELGGTSRTLRLLEALHARHPNHRLRLLVGGDILLESQRWHRFDEICRVAPLLSVGRTGYADESGAAGSTPMLPQVSSSETRATIARGGDVSAWLPARVLAYLTAHGLYGASPP